MTTLGVFGGAGASIEGGYSKPLTTGSSQSWGFFFNGGSGPASGNCMQPVPTKHLFPFESPPLPIKPDTPKTPKNKLPLPPIFPFTILFVFKTLP
jgi:hypothetical protein